MQGGSQEKVRYKQKDTSVAAEVIFGVRTYCITFSPPFFPQTKRYFSSLAESLALFGRKLGTLRHTRCGAKNTSFATLIGTNSMRGISRSPCGTSHSINSNRSVWVSNTSSISWTFPSGSFSSSLLRALSSFHCQTFHKVAPYLYYYVYAVAGVLSPLTTRVLSMRPETTCA